MTQVLSGNSGEKCSPLPVIASSQSQFSLIQNFCLPSNARYCGNDE